MKKISSIGLLLVLIGVTLLIGYGVYLGFEDIVKAFDFIIGFIVGLIMVGFAIVIVSIVIEQRGDTKEIKEKIRKEDLEP